MSVKPKYINRQQHKKSCGPVAILNTLKWLGHNLSYRDNIEYFESWGLDFKIGIYREDLKKTLKHFCIRTKFVSNCSINDIKQAIDGGHAVVLNYLWHNKKHKNASGHLVFIDHYTSKMIRAWNWSTYTKTPYLSKRRLQQDFRYSRGGSHSRKKLGYPCMWIVYRD